MFQAGIDWIRRHSTIKARTYFGIVGAVSLVFIVAVYSLYSQLAGFTEERRASIDFVLRELIPKPAGLALRYGNKDKEDLREIINTLTRTTHITSIAIYDIKGELFFRSEATAKPDGSEKVTVELYAKAVFDDTGAFDEAQRAQEVTEKVGTMVARVDQQSLRAGAWRSALGKGVALMVLAALAVPVAFLSVASLTHPLKIMMQGVQRFEKGDYSLGLATNYRDEYARLENALQHAGLAILAKQNELQRQVAAAIDARKSADEANARKDLLVVSMTHELKSPLEGVQSNLKQIEIGTLEVLQALEDSRPLPKLKDEVLALYRYAVTTGRGALDLAILINEILASICDGGSEIKLDEKPVRLQEALPDLMARHGERASTKGVSFRFDVLGNDALVLADWISVAQVINVLVDNAVKFTTEGSVTVDARFLTDADRVILYLYVTDTAGGMSADNQSYIQTLFAGQEINARRGTGLVIAQRITDRLGGTLMLRRSNSSGAVFVFECSFSRIGNIEDGNPRGIT